MKESFIDDLDNDWDDLFDHFDNRYSDNRQFSYLIDKGFIFNTNTSIKDLEIYVWAASKYGIDLKVDENAFDIYGYKLDNCVSIWCYQAERSRLSSLIQAIYTFESLVLNM